MSENKVKLELEKALLEDIFTTAGLPVPETFTQQAVQSAFAVIKAKIGSGGSPASAQPASPGAPPPPPPPPGFAPGGSLISQEPKTKSVLVVDDLGIIIYQVSTLLKKMGYEVVSSQEVNDAVKKFKEQDFSFAILDLFIPTDREGFYLLDEIKKISLLCKLDTKIIIMSASPKEAHKVQAYKHGANSFIEKAAGWQKKVIEEVLTLSKPQEQ